MEQTEKVQVCRLVAQAILVDGQITDEVNPVRGGGVQGQRPFSRRTRSVP